MKKKITGILLGICFIFCLSGSIASAEGGSSSSAGYGSDGKGFGRHTNTNPSFHAGTDGTSVRVGISYKF